MPRTLHIVEPTLSNHSGHCYGYAKSLLSVQQSDFTLQLWGDRTGKHLFPETPSLFQPYFWRKLRKLQLIGLYRKLLKQQQLIFIPTAGQYDLKILNTLCKLYGKTTLFLHFHQYRNSAKKRAALAQIAIHNPQWVILAPTEALLTIFKQAGFKHCCLVPCPVPLRPLTHWVPPSFKTVLYAGEMRLDKGFDKAVDFISFCQDKNLNIPITLQVSASRSAQAVQKCQSPLKQLTTFSYPYLTLYQRALATQEFQQLFVGAISLLLYDAAEYADKFSGVALDSFYAGAPVIATANTWAAHIITQFGGGIVIETTDPEQVLTAVRSICQHYNDFANQAYQTGVALRKLHDPANTLKILAQHERML